MRCGWGGAIRDFDFNPVDVALRFFQLPARETMQGGGERDGMECDGMAS